MKERMGKSWVVVGEPGAEWLVDDGVRLMPETREAGVQFHELFCGCLEDLGLVCEVLPCTVGDIAERVDLVMNRWK